MLNSAPAGHIWLCTEPTDMRCSFDGLSARVRRHLEEDPTSGHWFVFINRRRTMLKILAFDTGGYWIWSKRLERGQFATFGQSREGKRGLNRTDLLALLEGIDMQIIGDYVGKCRSALTQGAASAGGWGTYERSGRG